MCGCDRAGGPASPCPRACAGARASARGWSSSSSRLAWPATTTSCAALGRRRTRRGRGAAPRRPRRRSGSCPRRARGCTRSRTSSSVMPGEQLVEVVVDALEPRRRRRRRATSRFSMRPSVVTSTRDQLAVAQRHELDALEALRASGSGARITAACCVRSESRRDARCTTSSGDRRGDALADLVLLARRQAADLEHASR